MPKHAVHCNIRYCKCINLVGSTWNVMAHSDARKGKRKENWWMGWVASTLHTTSEHGVSSITTADAHTSTASIRLNWRPRRFKWTRPFRLKTKFGFCACAITFQLASTTGQETDDNILRRMRIAYLITKVIHTHTHIHTEYVIGVYLFLFHSNGYPNPCLVPYNFSFKHFSLRCVLSTGLNICISSEGQYLWLTDTSKDWALRLPLREPHIPQSEGGARHKVYRLSYFGNNLVFWGWPFLFCKVPCSVLKWCKTTKEEPWSKVKQKDLAVLTARIFTWLLIIHTNRRQAGTKR